MPTIHDMQHLYDIYMINVHSTHRMRCSAAQHHTATQRILCEKPLDAFYIVQIQVLEFLCSSNDSQSASFYIHMGQQVISYTFTRAHL